MGLNIKNHITLGKIRLRKAAPHVMIIVGVAGIIYTIVDACKISRKLDETLKDELDELKKAEEHYEQVKDDPEVSDEYKKETKRSIRTARRRAFFKGAKKFIRPALIGLASLILVGTAHVLLTKAVMAGSAVLNAVSAEYRDYRSAAREKFGDEVDKELRFASANKMKEKKEVVRVDKETGDETTETWDIIDGSSITGLGPYAIPFCKTYCGAVFMSNTYYDSSTIARAQEYIQDQLETYHKKVVFLDDVYKKFGFDVTPASRKAGWIEGDTPRIAYEYACVDWGQGNGPEWTYILDFNCRPDVTGSIPAPKVKWWGSGAGM